MNMKKLIAALLVMTMLLSAVSCLAAYEQDEMVYFKGSAYGYKGHNARHKTHTIVSKGSWSFCADDQNGNWVPVVLHTGAVVKLGDDGKIIETAGVIGSYLWFNKKYIDPLIYYPGIVAGIADGKLPIIGIRYGSGGGGRSIVRIVDGKIVTYVHKRPWKKVEATGKCNIREFAGLAYKTFGTLKKGKTLKFLGWDVQDTRGVWWHAVEYKGKERYVSSLYTKLIY